jgi:predicted ATPase
LRLAFTALLARLAQRQPLLLIFEDCQWMDTASMELLVAVATHSAAHPYALLAVRRTEMDPAQDLPERTSTNRSLTVPPLLQDETTVMVAHLLADCASPTMLVELGHMIHEKSQGNPLMVEELAVWWRENQGSPDLKINLHASVTLSELVMSRVDRLPTELRRLVQIATIPEGDFTHLDLIPLLAPDTASGEASAGKIQDELPMLADRQLLVRREAGFPPRYAFRQTLVREILYDSLPAARRRTYHARFALYLEEKPESAAAERLAHHHRQAQNWDRAAHYLLSSGEAAAQHATLAQAKSAFEAALEVLKHMEETSIANYYRIRAYEGMGDACFHTGDFSESAASYRAAGEALAEAGDSPHARATIVAAKRVVALFAGGERQILWEAEALYASGGGCAFVTAAALAWMDPLEDARSENKESAAWRHKAEYGATQLLTPNPTRVGALLAELQGDWDRAAELYAVMDEPFEAARALYHLAEAWLHAGDVVAADAAYRRAETIAQGTGDSSGWVLVACRWAEKLNSVHEAGRAEAALTRVAEWLDSLDFADPADRAMMHLALAAQAARQPISCTTSGWQSHIDNWRARQLFTLLEELEA